MQADVTVKKAELIEKIKVNMETHEATYEKAVVAFRKQQIELLESQLNVARKGRPIDRMALSRMPVPENHMDDYNRALRALEMHTGDEIELGEYDFNRFVLDEWEWTHSFLANTTSYVAG
jgi:hypothetical protein